MLFEANKTTTGAVRGFNRIKVERGENTGEASLTSLNEFGVNHESCRPMDDTHNQSDRGSISFPSLRALFNRNINAQTDGECRAESRSWSGNGKGCVRTTVTCLKTIYFGIQLAFTLSPWQWKVFWFLSHRSAFPPRRLFVLSTMPTKTSEDQKCDLREDGKNLFLSVNWFYNKFYSSHIYWGWRSCCCCLTCNRRRLQKETKIRAEKRRREKWTFTKPFTTLWIEI